MNVFQLAAIGCLSIISATLIASGTWKILNQNKVQELPAWCQTLCKNQVLSYTLKGEEKTCECKE